MTEIRVDRHPQILLTQPAAHWSDGFPLGNGRLGAVICGRPDREVIHLNEESLWRGGPRECDNPGAKDRLPELREMLFAGRPQEARTFAQEHLMGRPPEILPYVPLGELLLDFPGLEAAAHYRRTLDLRDAVASVRFSLEGVRHSREHFVSAVDQVLVIRCTAARRDRGDSTWQNPPSTGFTCRIGLDRLIDAESTVDGHDVVLRGRLDKGAGMSFEARARVVTGSGRIHTQGSRLLVSGTDEMVILLAATTNWSKQNFRHPADALERAAQRGYDRLRAAHVREHRGWFDRVELELGPTDSAVAALPTDARRERVRRGESDPGLTALYFDVGRYLLIGCNRPGSLPGNLQGLWNPDYEPMWDSDYHTNVNLQMNYWPAEVCGLPELHRVLLDWIPTLVEPGTKTARTHWGCRGWTVHHLTDLWGFTAPAHDAGVGLWPLGAAWLCLHYWDHFRFNGDHAYLESRYPLMREAAEFLLDFLIRDRGSEYLVTNPSHSPENRYRLPDGSVGWLCVGATMDFQIIRQFLAACGAAAAVLDRDGEFRARLEETVAKLPPHRVGRHGQLQEWMEDYDEVEPGHRHTSHLFALYPGDQITPRRTPGLAAACRQSIERRLAHGGAHTGWGRAWIVNFWARLHDGAEAHQSLHYLIARATTTSLLDTHPWADPLRDRRVPFQIDGNLGGCAGIAEMLLQSHEESLDLLPALPEAWPEGRVRGLRARGGVAVDLAWSGGRLREAGFTSRTDAGIAVRWPRNVVCPTREADGEAVLRLRGGRRLTLGFIPAPRPTRRPVVGAARD